MLEMHALFHGRVQGVGFRWTIVDHAEKHHLTGSVQNLANGAVEVIAQGSTVALEDFLNSVQADPGNAAFDSIQTTFHQPSHLFTAFSILG